MIYYTQLTICILWTALILLFTGGELEKATCTKWDILISFILIFSLWFLRYHP